MTTTKATQIKRNIIMVIGAIVVLIILVYAYMEIYTEEPVKQQLLKIKKEHNASFPEVDISFNRL